MEIKTLVDVSFVYWNPGRGNDPPRCDKVRAALASNNFSTSHAKDVPRTTAFQRVVDSLAVKTADGQIKASKLSVAGRPRWQLDLLSSNNGSRGIDYHKLAGWEMADDENKTIVTVYGDRDINDAVERAEGQYTWADVSAVIGHVLKHDGLGAYPLRSAGGLYCVPTTGTSSLLERLDGVAKAIGLRLMLLPVPSTEEGRNEVMDAVHQGLMDECDTHTKSISEYQADKTRPSDANKRKDAIAITRTLCERLRSQLGERAQSLLDRLNELDQLNDDVIEQIKAYRAPTSSGRRLAASSV